MFVLSCLPRLSRQIHLSTAASSKNCTTYYYCCCTSYSNARYATGMNGLYFLPVPAVVPRSAGTKPLSLLAAVA